MKAIRRCASGALARRTAGLLLALVALVALCARSATASTAYSAASAKPRLIPSTGWHGRPIQKPHKRVDAKALAEASYPAGWSAGAVRYGTGYGHSSTRVREVQRRLKRLGYRTGPVDGLYGPLTRSAVQWFQIKHGLRPTGVVAAATLTALRDPHVFSRPGTANRAKAPRAPRAVQQPQAAPPAQPRSRPAVGGSRELPLWLILAAGALLAAGLAAGVLTLVRASRRSRPVARSHGPASPPIVPDPPVLGYVSTDDPRSAAPHEAAIRAVCEDRGWALARLVRDARSQRGRALGRPGLSYALEQLTEGKASRLVVHELGHLARSVVELRVVLGWFMRTGIALTAIDVGLDTSSAEGRTAVRTLMSVAGSEQARITARTEPGLAAARGRRPAVKDRPELAKRIRAMRSEGMTLQAIADSLNEEGVPTARGAARWRPSSVQSVLGYKRAAATKEGDYAT
jgi:DNA invertase Pin-like site-specific DNA recombinase